MVGVLISIWSAVGGSWSVVCGLWSVAGRWAVVLYYAVPLRDMEHAIKCTIERTNQMANR